MLFVFTLEIRQTTTSKELLLFDERRWTLRSKTSSPIWICKGSKLTTVAPAIRKRVAEKQKLTLPVQLRLIEKKKNHLWSFSIWACWRNKGADSGIEKGGFGGQWIIGVNVYSSELQMKNCFDGWIEKSEVQTTDPTWIWCLQKDARGLEQSKGTLWEKIWRIKQ